MPKNNLVYQPTSGRKSMFNFYLKTKNDSSKNSEEIPEDVIDSKTEVLWNISGNDALGVLMLGVEWCIH